MAATNNNMNFDVNLLPTTTGDHNLGSSDKKWNLYVNNINGEAPLIGVKGSAESSYRTGNVEITKSNIGLGNVENTALSTWTGTSNITTLGTITTGTWNGTTIAVANGGTGATSIANIQAGKDGDGNTISSTYLKLSGGTLTDTTTIAATLRLKRTDITLSGSSANNGVTNDSKWRDLQFVDSADTKYAAIQAKAASDGSIETFLSAYNIATGGTDNIANYLVVGVNKNGEYYYKVPDDSAKAAFRNAIGASSGIWPVTLGGTGANSAAGARTNLGVACAIKKISILANSSKTLDLESGTRCLIFGYNNASGRFMIFALADATGITNYYETFTSNNVTYKKSSEITNGTNKLQITNSSNRVLDCAVIIMGGNVT